MLITHRANNPRVNLFTDFDFKVGRGANNFPAGRYKRADIRSKNLGVPGDGDGVSSFIVPQGLVAIFYNRDSFSTSAAGAKLFGPGAYTLDDGSDNDWNDKMVSMIVVSTEIVRFKGYWTQVSMNNGPVSYAVTTGFTKSISETREMSYSVSVSNSVEVSFGGVTASASVEWGKTMTNSYTSALETTELATNTVNCDGDKHQTVGLWRYVIDGFTRDSA